MQTIPSYYEQKTDSFLARLLKITGNLKASKPCQPSAPKCETSQVDEVLPDKKPGTFNRSIKSDEEEDREYEKLHYLLRKKMKAKPEGWNTQIILQRVAYIPTPKSKAGIMDNIGQIFECSYDVPKSRRRYVNTD